MNEASSDFRFRIMTTFQKSTIREYFESILVAVVLALFVRTFVFQAFKIPTGSMKPNLLVGDHLLVNKFVFAPAATPLERLLLPMRDIRRGDVVVFKFPEEPERDFIKRVIGLPGDTLELRNQTVLINGQPLEEPYAHYLFPTGAAADLAARAAGIPFVLTAHGQDVRNLARTSVRRATAGALRRAAGVIAVSHHLAEALRQGGAVRYLSA